MITKWDKRYLDLVGMISTWSKDPRGGVGAMIVSPENRVVSVGFNGFPRGVNDRRTDLYGKRVVLHAEENAILFSHIRLDGCTLYTRPLPTCSTCASRILQVGIKRVVSQYIRSDSEHWSEEQAESFRLAWKNLAEGGVKVLRYES